MNFFEPYISPKSVSLVNKVLKSGFLNQGPMVEQFEQALQDYGLCNPVTLNSCTSSLHLAFILSGVGPGDEVILPAQTFIATGLAVLMCGAKPVFCDIFPYSAMNQYLSIDNKITTKTKAIVVVHWGGLPNNLQNLFLQPRSKNIKIIEDAAHAFGAESMGNKIGSCQFSDYCCFSLQAIKTLTTGDGGILCCKNIKDHKKAVRLRWFGIDKKHVRRNASGDRSCQVSELGYKYHMNDVTAAIGLGNLQEIQKVIEKRRKIGHQYYNKIRNRKIIHPFIGPNTNPSFWLYTICVQNRPKFIKWMKQNDIPVSTVDTRIDKHPIFGGLTYLPNQEIFDKHQISIPCHHLLTKDQVKQIIETCNAY